MMDFEDLTYQDYDINKIHVELERLNIATDVINKLEVQLDEARALFREIQSKWTMKLEQLVKKLGGCIEKSRPYYESRLQARSAHQESQRAALLFERANSLHQIAKEQVSLTQESLAGKGSKVEPACLEVLNHHISRVNDSEIERVRCEEEHKRASCAYDDANKLVHKLEKELRRSINKSKPYFDTRVEFTRVLENQRDLIRRLESEIRQKKRDYATSLTRLEQISDEIHETRSLGQRGEGVGSESPAPLVSLTERSDPRDKRGLGVAGAAVSQKAPSEASTIIAQFGAPFTAQDPANRNRGERDQSSNSPRFNQPEQLEAPASPTEGRSFLGASKGVLSIANELSRYEFLGESRIRAFTVPVDFDCHYRTTPEGVKPLPTPPDTPGHQNHHFHPGGAISQLDLTSQSGSDDGNTGAKNSVFSKDSNHSSPRSASYSILPPLQSSSGRSAHSKIDSAEPPMPPPEPSPVPSGGRANSHQPQSSSTIIHSTGLVPVAPTGAPAFVGIIPSDPSHETVVETVTGVDLEESGGVDDVAGTPKRIPDDPFHGPITGPGSPPINSAASASGGLNLIFRDSISSSVSSDPADVQGGLDGARGEGDNTPEVEFKMKNYHPACSFGGDGGSESSCSEFSSPPTTAESTPATSARRDRSATSPPSVDDDSVEKFMTSHQTLISDIECRSRMNRLGSGSEGSDLDVDFMAPMKIRQKLSASGLLAAMDGSAVGGISGGHHRSATFNSLTSAWSSGPILERGSPSGEES